MSITTADPHAGAPVLAAGVPLDQARAAVLMVHGRGATADDILGLAAELPAAEVAYLAPQASGNTWYPHRFLEPIAENEPYLSSALALLRRLLDHVGEAGIPPERTVLLGFSQGACLALEYAARNPRRYGGVVGLSGGLIGPPGTRWAETGSLAGTPVFLGCSDVDFHIPAERVRESADHLKKLGAAVDLRLYPGMGHTINRDEIDAVRGIIAGIAA